MVELHTRWNKGEAHIWANEFDDPSYLELGQVAFGEHGEFTTLRINQLSTTPDVCTTDDIVAEYEDISVSLDPEDTEEVRCEDLEETLLDTSNESECPTEASVFLPDLREGGLGEEWVVDSSIENINLIDVEWT